MLWLGDNLYLQQPDLYDPASMAARYRRQRAFAPLQKLLTATSHLAIWDDHDYGPNDSDASYVLKGETLEALPALLAESELRPARRRRRRSASRATATCCSSCSTIATTARPNAGPTAPDKTMFGARQLEWLKQALVSAPRSAIKIVAGGSQFWNRGSRFEGWQHFATERDAFAAWLLRARIEGVIFVSGDRHFGELLRIERPGAYPLYEFTSSPLTSRPPARLDKADSANPDVVPDTLVASSASSASFASPAPATTAGSRSRPATPRGRFCGGTRSRPPTLRFPRTPERSHERNRCAIDSSRAIAGRRDRCVAARNRRRRLRSHPARPVRAGDERLQGMPGRRTAARHARADANHRPRARRARNVLRARRPVRTGWRLPARSRGERAGERGDRSGQTLRRHVRRGDDDPAIRHADGLRALARRSAARSSIS